MAGMNTLQMIKSIPKFDGKDFIEWTRLFNDMLQLSSTFLSKLMYGLERPIPGIGSREEIENAMTVVHS